MSPRPFLGPLVLLLLAAAPPAAAAPQEASAPEPQGLGAAEEASYREEPAGIVPEIEVSLPEGEFDFRLNRLVEKIFFEGQLKYDFVDGDVAAFLRYRYYGFHRTYQLSVFDAIEFEDFEDFSDEFERVRGGLFLVRWPHDFHQRTFFAAELDDISSNKEDQFLDNGKTNTFVRLGYQVGTPDDTRSNAIVGEPRARIRRLFTPFRTIGPGDAGVTAAATWGFDSLGGDFDYVKLEAEALKRFELPGRTFLIGRLHGGTFPRKREREDPPDSRLVSRYLIPFDELFRLNGRDNLRGLDREQRGTEELHLTWELLVPWFVDRNRTYLKADWQTWYWVVYTGYGASGFDRAVLADLSEYVADAGLGLQSSFRIRGYSLFLSALAARAFESNADVKVRVTLKTYH